MPPTVSASVAAALSAGMTTTILGESACKVAGTVASLPVNVRAERFPLMDSLRAVAALSVLAFHAAFFAGMYTSDSPLRPYLAQPLAGVTVFFVISGFLLYRPFVRARAADDPAPRASAYAWRRFLRIVPAYWLALTVIAVWLSLDTVFHPAWHV